MPTIEDIIARRSVRPDVAAVKKGILRDLAAAYAESPWTLIEMYQYTPYFNDGDPCTHSIGEVGVDRSNKWGPVLAPDGEFLFHELYDFDPEDYPEAVVDLPTSNDGSQIGRLIVSMEDDLEYVFGTNCTLRFEYKDGRVEVVRGEYEPGY